MSIAGEFTAQGGGPLGKFGRPLVVKQHDHAVEMCVKVVKTRIEAEGQAATPNGCPCPYDLPALSAIRRR